MSRYRFTARDAAGLAVCGVREASGAAALASALEAERLIPLTIEEHPQGLLARLHKGLFVAKAPGSVEVMLFCRQMHSLLQARVPLLRALASVRGVTRQPGMAAALDGVLQSLHAGQPLALALRQQPQVFAPLAVSLVHAGEETGTLDEAFDHIASNLEREQHTRRQIWTALRYPLLVLLLLFAALTIINIFAMPAFMGIYARLKVELPLATRLLMGLSRFSSLYGAALLATLALASLLAWLGVQNARGQRLWHRWQLRLPLFGAVLHLCQMARFCRALALMVRARMPLLHGLAVAAEVSNNRHLREGLLDVRAAVARGQSLAQSAEGSGLFSPLVVQMLAVGEETGALDLLMDEASRHYEGEAEYCAQTFTGRLQPALLAVMAAVVALVAAGVFLPMWGMVDGIGRG